LKKFIFSFFVLLLFLISCKEEFPPYEDEDSATPNVEYDDTWRYVSLYLEGDAPISINTNTRAMTADTSRRGFDYFEAVFCCNEDIRRSQWRIDKRASINIYTTAGGIDYQATSLPSANNACAVLFAGRESDKTLLAIGKLYSVDDEITTVIKNNSVKVTFVLSAFNAGVDAVPENSAFLTNSKNLNDNPNTANTRVIEALIGGNPFPLFVLPPSQSVVKAQYYFGLKGDSLGLSGDWNDFKNSVIAAAKGEAETREVRYPAGNGRYYYPKYGIDVTTKVTMTNNQAAGVPLQNPVTFTIDTSETISPVKQDNGLFALTFKVPVYAVTPPAQAEDFWYIRPAYMSYNYNIDNGVKDNSQTDKNNGGAVLIGVDVEAANFDIPAERR